MGACRGPAGTAAGSRGPCRVTMSPCAMCLQTGCKALRRHGSTTKTSSTARVSGARCPGTTPCCARAMACWAIWQPCGSMGW